MRYALVSDIHANWPAWCAVRDDFRAQRVDAVVCLGDVVGYGPAPQRVLADVRACCDQILLGNHEAAAVGRLDLSIFNDAARRAAEWTATQLDDEAKTFLLQLPLIAEDEDMLFVHADPVSPEEWGYVESCKDAEACFAATEQRLIFVGHTHFPEIFARSAAGEVTQLPPAPLVLEAGCRYVVNVGSTGEPRDGSALATYCIYDATAQQLEFRRLDFDLEALRAELKLQPQLDLPWFLRERTPEEPTEKRDHAISVAQVASRTIRVTTKRVRMQVRRTQNLQSAPPTAPAIPQVPKPDAAAMAKRRKMILIGSLFFGCALCLFVVAAVIYFWPEAERPVVAIAPAPAPVTAAPAFAAPPPKPAPIVLSATQADVQGREIKFEQHDGGPIYIAYWNQPQDKVSWKVQVLKPGRYTFSMVYAVDRYGGSSGGIELLCGAARLTHKPKKTGTWYNFETATLGTLDLPAGTHTVLIRALGKINGGLMNLREVHLQRERD